jgi:hypothetical protein
MSNPTLQEMYEASRFQADLRFGQLSIRAKLGRPDDPILRHDAEVFERLTEVLATLATYPDETRVFYAGLIKRHRQQ